MCAGCFFDPVRWQIVTLYWYCDDPEPYWPAAEPLPANAGPPRIDSGTSSAAVTATPAITLPLPLLSLFTLQASKVTVAGRVFVETECSRVLNLGKGCLICVPRKQGERKTEVN